jgi:hypothetical protein
MKRPPGADRRSPLHIGKQLVAGQMLLEQQVH